MLTHDAMRGCWLTSLVVCINDKVRDIRERNVTIKSEIWTMNICSLGLRECGECVTLWELILWSLGCMLLHVLLGRHILESHPCLHIICCSSMSCWLSHARKLGLSCPEHYRASLGQWDLVHKGPLVGGRLPMWIKISWWLLQNPSILHVPRRLKPLEPNGRDCSEPKLHRWVRCISCVLHRLCLYLLFWGEISLANGV